MAGVGTALEHWRVHIYLFTFEQTISFSSPKASCKPPTRRGVWQTVPSSQLTQRFRLQGERLKLTSWKRFWPPLTNTSEQRAPSISKTKTSILLIVSQWEICWFWSVSSFWSDLVKDGHFIHESQHCGWDFFSEYIRPSEGGTHMFLTFPFVYGVD